MRDTAADGIGLTISPTPGAGKRSVIPAIDGLRFVAAVAIYLFHLQQAHAAGVMRFDAIDQLPWPIRNLLSHGHVATGLFFVLSGFLLTYVYTNDKGVLKTSVARFMANRWIGLYPIYLLSLLLIAPLPALLPIAPKDGGAVTLIAGVGTSLTLTQAWVPSLALFWNPPAWALSATVAFYFAYPGAIAFLRPASARILFILLIILSLLSLVPPLLYLAFDPERNALSATATTIGGNWLAALRFHPIVWLPSFLSGIVLARLLDCSKSACRPSDLVGRLALQGRASLDGERFPIDLAGVGIRSGSTLQISAGDLAILLGVVMLALPLPTPYVLLRHGLFLPIHLVVVWELAHGRGLASRLLSASLLRQWSKASFGLFALQMPVGVWFAYLVIRRRNGSAFELLAMILATLTASYYISQVIDRHVTRPLRKKINSATDGPRSNSP